MRIDIEDIISIILESKKQRGLAMDKLLKAGKGEDFDELLSLTDTDTEKHLPKLADYVLEQGNKHQRVSTDAIIKYVGFDYKRFLNSKLKDVDIFKYKTFEDFRNALHNVRTGGGPLADAEEPPVYKDETFEVYKGDTPWKCMQHGKGYTWCVSSKRSNLFYSYRSRQEYIFYFVRNLTKSSEKDADNNFEDIHHHLVVGVNNNNRYNITMADNGAQGGGTEDNLDEAGVLKIAPELAPLFAEDVFQPKPMTSEERVEIDMIKDDLDAEEFEELNFDQKEKYILFGHELDIEHWELLDDELKEVYINAGGHDIPDGAEDATSPKLMKRYQSTLKNRIDIKIQEDVYLTNDETEFFNNNIGIWIPASAKYAGKFEDNIITLITRYLARGMDMDKLSILANPVFKARALLTLEGFEKLSIEQFKLIANPIFDRKQMYELGRGFKQGLSVEQIKIYADPSVNSYNMEAMSRALRFGLSIKDCKTLRSKDYDANELESAIVELTGMSETQRDIIIHAREKGLSDEEIKILSNPEYDNQQMIEVNRGLGHADGDRNLINLFINLELSSQQMRRIVDGFHNSRLSYEDVALYAKPEYDQLQMLSINKALWGRRFNYNDTGNEDNFKTDTEAIEAILNPTMSSETMTKVVNAFKKGYGRQFLKAIDGQELGQGQLDHIQGAFDKGWSAEYIKLLLDPRFDYSQIVRIKNGIQHGLSVDQLALYAKPEFNVQQMASIQFAIENAGLSMEQCEFIANPVFNNKQMDEIRRGFVNRLTIEQVLVYAKPEFDDEQMSAICQALMYKVDMATILKYANPNYTEDEMLAGMLGD